MPAVDRRDGCRDAAPPQRLRDADEFRCTLEEAWHDDRGVWRPGWRGELHGRVICSF